MREATTTCDLVLWMKTCWSSMRTLFQGESCKNFCLYFSRRARSEAPKTSLNSGITCTSTSAKIKWSEPNTDSSKVLDGISEHYVSCLLSASFHCCAMASTYASRRSPQYCQEHSMRCDLFCRSPYPFCKTINKKLAKIISKMCCLTSSEAFGKDFHLWIAVERMIWSVDLV